MRLRPLNGWVVIRDLDPDERKIGSIHIPEGSVESPYKWAEVLDVGKGAPLAKNAGYSQVELFPGEHVYYVRFLKNTHTGLALVEKLEELYGPGAFLIQEKDVLCAKSAE